MELALFIRAALGEIAMGVHAAKSDVRDLVAIVPGSMDGESVREKTYIEFDVAVTADGQRQTKSGSSAVSGVGISVMGIRANIGGSISENDSVRETESRASRIAFKVPVYLNAHFRNDPGSDKEADRMQERWEVMFPGPDHQLPSST